MQLASSILFKENAVIFKKIAIFFDIRKWEKGQNIWNQGETVDHFYWILEGSCSVRRKVPFLEKKTSKGKEIVNKNFSANELDKNDNLVYITLGTQDNLEIGDWFPPLPVPKKELSTSSASIDTKEWVYYGRIQHPFEFTITADTKHVLTARISFEDLMDLSNISFLSDMHMSPRVIKYTQKELQQSYIDQLQWEKHKQGIISNVGKG